MFGFLQSEKSKLRNAAKHWLYLGDKVYNYRKDELSEGDLSKLGRLLEEVKGHLRERIPDPDKLGHCLEKVEGHLKIVGGSFYPRSSLSENVDFFFYVLIVYIGFTAFFIKPFKIPTNSMWPTYSGMTEEVWTEANEAPGGLSRLFRLLSFGAVRYTLKAPETGELLVPVIVDSNNRSRMQRLPISEVSKRRYLVLPGKGLGYSFQIGDTPAIVKTPRDFRLEEKVLGESIFPGEPSFYDAIQSRLARGEVRGYKRVTGTDTYGRSASHMLALVETGKTFEKGDLILSFDILTGDQLFVDRMSYHFAEPDPGDGFVFRTTNIPRLMDDGEKFYIKRLAGVPGNTLRIEDNQLYRNGELATGGVGFEKNNAKTPPYDGYFNAPTYDSLLRAGETITIPENKYVALGDNSDNSRDSRAWGYVPEENIIGRPIMIYYPFTSRFGLAK